MRKKKIYIPIGFEVYLESGEVGVCTPSERPDGSYIACSGCIFDKKPSCKNMACDYRDRVDETSVFFKRSRKGGEGELNRSRRWRDLFGRWYGL